MKYLISLSLLVMLSNTIWSQDTWVKTLGGTKDDVSTSISTTSDGGILITGYTGSNDVFFYGMSKGGVDIFVIKLDKNGKILWKKTFGGTKNDVSTSITTTSDGGSVITGNTVSVDGDFEGMNKGSLDIFVIKLDKDGDVLWKKTIGGRGEDRGSSLITQTDGGILVTGVSSYWGDFDGMSKGGKDIFVIKLDKDGQVLWKKTFGGTKDDESTSITTTSDGGSVITGNTISVDGDFEGMNKGQTDIFVIRLDKDGQVQWKKTFGGSNYDEGFSLVTQSDGGILISGDFPSNDGDFKGMNKGGQDIFIMKLDKDGNLKPQGKNSKKK